MSKLDVPRAISTPIKELGESERALFKQHLLDLEADDRYLRFGNPLSDEAITNYVDRIDFATDTVFGVFDDALTLVAAGHFAPTRDDAPGAVKSAEFGLSVATIARGKGLGTALFYRAASHARNLQIATLFMHCLSQNRAMIRIARKAGMEIQQSQGEADAYLSLPPGDLASAIEEGVQEQIAIFDYAIKRHLLAARGAFRRPVALA